MKFESSQRSQIRKPRLRKLKRGFCFYHFIQCIPPENRSLCTFRFASVSEECGGQIWGHSGSMTE